MGPRYANEAGAVIARRGFAAGLDGVRRGPAGQHPVAAVCRRLDDPLGRTSRWYGAELEAFRLRAR
jgi:hypothetical protein